MGEIAQTTMTKKRKKKGRPSLLDLQKRSLKQQQLQQQQQQQNQNPSFKNPNSLNAYSTPNSRSTRHNSNPDETDWIGGDDDDERKEKKHKLLLGLNSQQHNHHHSISPANSFGVNSYGSDSNAGSGNPEAGPRRRKISAGRLGSDDMGEKASKATDALHGSPVEPGPTTPLPDKKLLVFVLDRLQKKDTYGVFSEPVDPEELPDYHDIIEHPMDFATVRKKLDEGAYGNLEQFEKDVFLIFSNAMQYNSPDTIYFRQARSMQELAKKDFENLRQDSDDDSEPQPKVVRRGRPPGKIKKPIEKSPFDRVGPEFSSDATLATGGDNASLSNGYNLRRTTLYKHQPADVLKATYGSHSSETYATWLSEWENEFPASVVKAVLKYGKKPFAIDENRRDSYKHSLSSVHQPSVLTTFEGELKQLMVVGLSFEHGYARSLARFAADLGPSVWKIASKKIKSVLPMGHEFGPGWVGENKRAEELQVLFSDKLKVPNNYASDEHFSRQQPVTTMGTNSNITSRDSAWGTEDVVETIGGSSSPGELISLNNCVGGLKPVPVPVPSVPTQRKPIIPSDMNGFSGGFGYNCPPQIGIARFGTQTGSLDHNTMPSQMFGMVPTGNVAFNSVPGNDFNSNKPMLSETSSGLLLSGNSSALGSRSDSQTLLSAGFGGKSSWQALSPYHQQDFLPFPPDLNVGFLAPSSSRSSVPIGSPRQPDLALQL